MKLKGYDYPAMELGMRVLLLIQGKKLKPDFTKTDLMHEVCSEFGTSRATAYRMVSAAIDLLGVDYEQWTPERLQKMGDRVSSGHSMRVAS